MPCVVPVKFAYAARDLWFDAFDLDIVTGDHVVCATERGTEIGLVTQDPFTVTDAEVRARSERGLKPVLRVADDDDLDEAEELAAMGEDALPVFRRLVSASGLDIKPVAVEYLFGREKVVCYFAAEERVDFRQLVRDLSRELHERIDMRQIGVREEAALRGGFAHCGQELCCARFGQQFEPVSIRMAKEQDLPLNSTKISGVCGRLMCCLRYEFEAYRDFKSRAPKKNAVIQTPLGTAKIVEYDTPKEQLALRLENGKTVRVPLSGMETSEAAVRKSEELHCPCRPDTVPRSTLDQLTATDIQMMLAELDRKNGVVPRESDPSDIFEDVARATSRRKRRRAAAEQAAEQASSAAAEDVTPVKRRRRRGAGAAAEAAPVAEDQPTTSTRRRRHHRSAEATQDVEASQAQETSPSGSEGRGPSDRPKKGMQPRRRRKPGDGQGAHAAPAPASETPKDVTIDGEAAPKKRRRRRKPKGDGEVTKAPVAQEKTAHAPAHMAPAPRAGSDAATEAEGAPKRRRRRRGGRGRGHGGAGQGDGSAPAPTDA